MSHRVGNGALIANAHIVSSNGGLGIPGQDIPATGAHGAAYAYDSLVLPADNLLEIQGLITTEPFVVLGPGSIANFTAYEDTSFDLTITDDCIVGWKWDLYVDGVLTTSNIAGTIVTGDTVADIQATTASLLLTSFDAVINLNTPVLINVSTPVLNLVAFDVIVNVDVPVAINATTASLNLISYNVVVYYNTDLKLSDLIKFIAPEVPGCPMALINNKIVTKTIEFCETSEAWRHTIIPIDIIAGKSLYLLNTPPETQVVGIKNLFDNDCSIAAKSEQQIDSNWPQLKTTLDYHAGSDSPCQSWRTASSARATHFYQPEIHQVRLFPTPDQNKLKGLTGTIVVKPLPDGTNLSRNIYNQFYDAITAGVKADLMAMPGKDWTNLEMVSFYTSKFIAGIGHARGKEARSNQTTNNTTGRTRTWS
jgi:hypothetical protein